MSRSYKRNLVFKGGKHGSRSRKAAKTLANRAVRNTEDISNGKAYRKMFNPWDISDYRMRYNPNTRTYSWGGTLRVIHPDPIWKWRSK